MPIAALRKRRQEIAAEIRELTAALVHLDATIRLFEPEYRSPRLKRGEMTRALLDVLREAEGPMTAREIAEAAGMDVKRVAVALSQQASKGAVRKVVPGRWGMAG